jgi:hypothetical protein
MPQVFTYLRHFFIYRGLCITDVYFPEPSGQAI